jgi:hypothetical protein
MEGNRPMTRLIKLITQVAEDDGVKKGEGTQISVKYLRSPSEIHTDEEGNMMSVRFEVRMCIKLKQQRVRIRGGEHHEKRSGSRSAATTGAQRRRQERSDNRSAATMLHNNILRTPQCPSHGSLRLP